MARPFVVSIALGGAAFLCTLAGSTFANWSTVIDHRPGAIGMPVGATFETPAPVGQRPRSQEEAIPGREPAVDLYGNEVTDAVAGYRLDSRGALYEEHSPDTEMPRLKAPQS